jgi:hypothetical protein
MKDKTIIRYLKKNIELKEGDGYFLLIYRDNGRYDENYKKANIQLSRSEFNTFELTGLLEYAKQEILKLVREEKK